VPAVFSGVASWGRKTRNYERWEDFFFRGSSPPINPFLAQLEKLPVRMKFRVPAIFLGWHEGIEKRVTINDKGIFFPGVIAPYLPFSSSREQGGGISSLRSRVKLSSSTPSSKVRGRPHDVARTSVDLAIFHFGPPVVSLRTSTYWTSARRPPDVRQTSAFYQGRPCDELLPVQCEFI